MSAPTSWLPQCCGICTWYGSKGAKRAAKRGVWGDETVFQEAVAGAGWQKVAENAVQEVRQSCGWHMVCRCNTSVKQMYTNFRQEWWGRRAPNVSFIVHRANSCVCEWCAWIFWRFEAAGPLWRHGRCWSSVLGCRGCAHQVAQLLQRQEHGAAGGKGSRGRSRSQGAAQALALGLLEGLGRPCGWHADRQCAAVPCSAASICSHPAPQPRSLPRKLTCSRCPGAGSWPQIRSRMPAAPPPAASA
jgi:hypothetical protein